LDLIFEFLVSGFGFQLKSPRLLTGSVPLIITLNGWKTPEIKVGGSRHFILCKLAKETEKIPAKSLTGCHGGGNCGMKGSC
jgi:hypothetical protein